MDLRENGISKLKISQLMPEGFSFYHLGYVEAVTEEQPAPISKALEGAAFSIQGEIRGVMLILFEKGLDTSAYVEMGNILASRLATHLSLKAGLDVMISPPKLLNAQELITLIQSQQTVAQKNYLHVHQGKSIQIKALVLSSPMEDIAHA